MAQISWHFSRIGIAIGHKPFLFLCFSIILLLPGFYGLLWKRKISLGIDENYTRLDAPSRREIAYQKSFFGASH
uniref:Uncharacterized protein n=1 Tax=Panagrolaimus sp. PS1159 TaxID=55785 RepID=A0AC35G606_9BILA